MDINECIFNWVRANQLDINNLDLPVTQAYGICFNDSGEILAIKGSDGSFKLPGGTPDPGETHIETLAREFYEEVTIIIKDPVFIGANLVEFTKGQDPRSGFKKYYQLRFICKIKEMHELMPDPDDGKINERYFIKAEEIPHYVKWGKVGDLMFRQGISKAKELGWLS